MSALLSTLPHEQSATQVPVVFGCETRETGEIFNQEADGILGLGNSPISLVNQARAAVERCNTANSPLFEICSTVQLLETCHGTCSSRAIG